MVAIVEFAFFIGLAVFGMVMLFFVYLLGSIFFGAVFGEDSGDAVGVIGWTAAWSNCCLAF